MKLAALAILPIILVAGCTERTTATRAEHNYALFQGSTGIFLVDSVTGKVWHLDAMQNIFLEIPIGSPNSVPVGATMIAPGSDGKLHYTNGSKTDLGIAPDSAQGANSDMPKDKPCTQKDIEFFKKFGGTANCVMADDPFAKYRRSK